jgi:uncharacterized protein
MSNTQTGFRQLKDRQLSIFRQDQAAFSLFYAPGYLVVVDKERVASFENSLSRSESSKWPAGDELRRHAFLAEQAWLVTQTRHFAPVCLTLYLNNECNLNCIYCYADPSPHAGARLSLTAVRTAAEVVIKNCVARQYPFTVVFHGGGEPSLNRRLADRILDELELVAAQNNIPIFRYIATNGVMSAAKAAWMAASFDLIGISCDGPESIQAYQRPLTNGKSSSPFIERTVQIIHQAGKPLHIRTTITNYSFQRQTEIAAYICQHLNPKEIHVEPVYQAGRAGKEDSIPLEQAEVFVKEFLNARKTAQAYGVPWLTSGSRPTEIHGPYCNISRDVLNLVPGGTASACFKTTTMAVTESKGFTIGKVDRSSQRFIIDYERIKALRQNLWHSPMRCNSCFNQYHCVRSCPDHCPLDRLTPAFEFRCQVQRNLAATQLYETAKRLRANMISQDGVSGGKVSHA